MPQPMTQKHDHLITIHGHTRNDPYYWLRDDTRQNPEVLDQLGDENRHFEATMAHTRELQTSLYEEMTRRLDPDDSSVPYPVDDYWYYSRFEAGTEFPIHARRKGDMDGDEELLLNANERATGHEYYALGGIEVSDDHRFLAIAEDTVGRRKFELRIYDIDRGVFAEVLITGASAAMAWSQDGHYLFYLKKHPETLLAYQLMRHQRGTGSDLDVLVYEETDNSFYTSLARSRSGEYIFMFHHSTETSEVQLLEANKPTGTFRPFLAREQGHDYDIDHAGAVFYIRSNWEAINFRVMSASLVTSTDKTRWLEIIEARDDVLVDSIQAFDDWLVLGERENGLRQMRVIAHNGGMDQHIKSDEPVFAMWPGFNVTTHSNVVRYVYTSLVTPTETREIDLLSGDSCLLKAEKVAGYDSCNYLSQRRQVITRDNTPVPVSLVHHRDTPIDGTAPALIYAYGAYGYSVDPCFSSSVISLLERGFVYVIAHVRGGQDMGRQWYENGKLLNKYNTFYDFIDISLYLQRHMIIDPERTYAMGGSAGGLLMGAIINLAPQLYHGVIAAVPFVDIVTTMLDESIPLTTGEFDEWGNPAEKAHYDNMLSYSPYDQVREQDYPNLMVTTGLHDSQVQYWEPAKWVAKLREFRTNNNILIMYTDMDAGHGGASGRYKRFRDIAREYAFLLDLAF